MVRPRHIKPAIRAQCRALGSAGRALHRRELRIPRDGHGRRHGRAGAFIVPQSSAPFRLSGAPHYTVTRSDAISELYEQTGIEMAAGCGVDTSFYRNDWHDVAPLCEVVLCEFEEAQAYREAHPPKSTTARAVRSQHAAAHDDGRQAALFA